MKLTLIWKSLSLQLFFEVSNPSKNSSTPIKATIPLKKIH